MIGVFAPTAAIPSEPPSAEKWPIMATSMKLESCSRMLVAATGSANIGTAFHSEPVRILESSCICLAF